MAKKQFIASVTLLILLAACGEDTNELKRYQYVPEVDSQIAQVEVECSGHFRGERSSRYFLCDEERTDAIECKDHVDEWHEGIETEIENQAALIQSQYYLCLNLAQNDRAVVECKNVVKPLIEAFKRFCSVFS